MDTTTPLDVALQALSLIGIIALVLERMAYYLATVMMKRTLLCHCESCCGLFSSTSSVTEDEKEDKEETDKVEMERVE